jgi:nucleotide-binding universal stress UspA family protein
MMKILVPLDGSKFTETILPEVARMAVTSDSELTMVMIRKDSRVGSTWIVPPWPCVPWFDITGGRIPGVEPPTPIAVESFSQAVERARAEARDYLQHLARRYCPSARIDVLVAKQIARDLLTYARRNLFDIIAMAAPEPSNLPRFLMHSVARNLITNNKVPVLLVRAQRFPVPGPIAAWQAM